MEEKLLKLQMAQTKDYLDIKDVALLSNLSISSIRRRIEDGTIKAIQDVPRGKLIFKRKNILSWLEQGVK
tara:strand:- start:744 stop:953 length:210 start_codon:yes stop_codon:yes gene_type:complete